MKISLKWELVRRTEPVNWNHMAFVLLMVLTASTPAAAIGVPALVLVTILQLGKLRTARA